MNIIEVIESEKLFRPLFGNITTWGAWFSYLKALFALDSPTRHDLATFKELSQTAEWPVQAYRESYVVAGRRSGKSTIVAVIAVFLALFRDWKAVLSKGETGYIFIIAVNKSQAGIIRDKVEALLDLQPAFRRMVRRVRQDEIELTNGITIAIKPASFRSSRGFTILCCILEELSFWRYEEAAIPDIEIVRALRPGLVVGGLMIGISSPWGKSGFLYEQVMKYRGVRGGPLIWIAPTERMNPTYDKQKIQEAYSADPVSASTEYGGQFRSDTSNYIDSAVVDACVAHDRHQLAYRTGMEYAAFIDASGGRQDSFTLAIAHREKGKIVLDVAAERVPPFRPETVIEEFAKTIRTYNLREAQSDRYAGELLVSPFRTHGIEIKNSERTKSELYLELLPLLLNGKVELLDVPRLVAQLKSLDRKVRAGGRDMIDNFYGHDDVANAVAGACVMAALEEDTGPGFVYHGGMVDVQETRASPSDGESWGYCQGMYVPPKSEDIAKAIREEVKQRAKEIYSKHGYVSPAGIAHSMGISPEVVKNNLFKLGYIELKKNQFIPKEVDDLN